MPLIRCAGADSSLYGIAIRVARHSGAKCRRLASRASEHKESIHFRQHGGKNYALIL
jgi:hypothetical protein